MDPIKAFRLSRKSRIALVGSGGKSRLMFCLGQAFLPLSNSVFLTTTTHISREEAALGDLHLVVDGPDDLFPFRGNLPGGGILVTGKPLGNNRFSSPNPAALREILNLADDWDLPLIIEADGSRQRPIKAPAPHEPAIPDFIDLVIVVIGITGIGHPIDEQTVHRPERFAKLASAAVGDRITPSLIIRVLKDPAGGLKDIPEDARRIAFLHSPDEPEMRSQAGVIAHALLGEYSSAVIGELSRPGDSTSLGRMSQGPLSLRLFSVHESVAGVVLAAGGSSRFGGQVKQLLIWRGEPLIRHVVRSALEGGLDPVIVVTGEAAGEIERAVGELPVVFVNNPEWQEGQSTSVRSGIMKLPDTIGAVVFLLADQPQITPMLLRGLVETHQQTLAPIVAPLVNGKRGNPVLFDKETFPRLTVIRGDEGGRALFSEYSIEWLSWADEGVLLDIDTPEDFARFLAKNRPDPDAA